MSFDDLLPYLERERVQGPGYYYDPVFENIYLPPLMRQALDLPEMQRLRRLRQLGPLYLVFPGANHTRFEHSVGVYQLVGFIWQTLQRMNEDMNLNMDLSHNLFTAVQLAAIFHDVGHGPFSHVFEMFCRRYQKYKEYGHEQITHELISQGRGTYCNIPVFLRRLAKSKEKNGESKYSALFDPLNIANLATSKPPTAPGFTDYNFLSEIISYVAGADRMDYLLRDSLHTGVRIGSTDIWEIIHNFTLCKDNGVWSLKVRKNAASAVEAFLMARDIAYRKVYYNEVHRMNQELIIRSIYGLVEKEYSEGELVLLDDDELLHAFESERGTAFTHDVARRIKTRKLYEPLPFSLNADLDLTEESRNNRKELMKIKYKELMELERHLASLASLPTSQTIIFDLEMAPLSKDEDFTIATIYDPDSQKLYSLLQCCPHLELLYGEYKGPFGSFHLGEIYINRLSNFYIYVPLELIVSIRDRVEGRLKDKALSDKEDKALSDKEDKALSDKEDKALSDKELTDYIANKCDNEYKDLTDIVISFIDLLGITGVKKDELKERFKHSVCLHLGRLTKDSKAHKP
ncbi:MAG: HD domain-containing protein [Nitrososphaeria archaeon]